MSRGGRGILKRCGQSLLLAFFAVQLASCARPFEEQRAPRRIPQYDKNAFKDSPPPDQGEPARFEFLGTVDVKPSYFNKRYNRKNLDAVIGASGFSTVEYGQRLGIEMYRVPRPTLAPTAPIYYVTLDEPPREFDYIWERGARDPNHANGVLVGVYFDGCPHRGDCSPSAVVRPVIMVDESSERWTLVHELMHYMFDSQRKAERAPDLAVLEPQREGIVNHIRATMQAYAVEKSEATLSTLLTAYDQLAAIVYQRLVVKELEEMTVELQLLTEYDKRRFKNVSGKPAKSALWYMRLNRDEALKMLTALDEQVKAIASEATQNNWSTIYRRTTTLLDFTNSVRTATKDMLEKAGDIIQPQSDDADMPLFLLANPFYESVAPVPCSSQDPAEKAKWNHALTDLNDELKDLLR